jgi:hypothetical protein
MYRRMSLNEIQALDADERRKYLRCGFLFPISGGEGEGEGEGGEGSGEGESDGAGGGEEEEDDDDVLEISRRDYKALKDSAKAARDADKAREAAEKKAADKAKREAGEFEELLKEKDEQIASLEAERDDVAHKFDTHVRENRVKDQARQFGFKDAADAMANLTTEDTEDEQAVIRALRRVARQKPYLVDPRKATGAPMGAGNGGGTSGTLTMEQVKQMSQEEIIERMDEVEAAMAASAGNSQ